MVFKNSQRQFGSVSIILFAQLLSICVFEVSSQYFPNNNMYGGPGGGGGMFGNPYQSMYPGGGQGEQFPGGQFPGYGNNFQNPYNNFQQPGNKAIPKKPQEGQLTPQNQPQPPQPNLPNNGQYSNPQNQNQLPYIPNNEYQPQPQNGYNNPQRPFERPNNGQSQYVPPQYSNPQQVKQPGQPLESPQNQYAGRPSNIPGKDQSPNQENPNQPKPNANPNPHQNQHNDGRYIHNPNDGKYTPDNYGAGKTDPLLDVRQKEPASRNQNQATPENQEDMASGIKQETPAWSFFEPETSDVKN